MIKTSALVMLSAVLVFAEIDQGTAEHCLTCGDKKCEVNLLAKCDTTSASSIPELGISVQNAHKSFGCLELEYLEGLNTKKLKQCIVLTDEDFCQTVQGKLNIVSCKIHTPTHYQRLNNNMMEDPDRVPDLAQTTKSSTKSTEAITTMSTLDTTIPTQTSSTTETSTTKSTATSITSTTTATPEPTTKSTETPSTKSTTTTTTKPTTKSTVTTSTKSTTTTTTEPTTKSTVTTSTKSTTTTTTKPATKSTVTTPTEPTPEPTKPTVSSTSSPATTESTEEPDPNTSQIPPRPTSTPEPEVTTTGSAISIVRTKLSMLTIVTLVVCYL